MALRVGVGLLIFRSSPIVCSPRFSNFSLNYLPRIRLPSSIPRFHSTMAKVKTRYNNIIKSANDEREYRGLELSNGMKVILISDSTTDKSAASLTVSVGYMSDPDDLEGLAHFCEHMLFLGTEKYPVENEYTKYISEHGGSNNAFTGGDHTCYYFDVTPQHFHGALDRFSQFFKKPLFTESATEREVGAVNSEHEKNIQLDTWRLNCLLKSSSKPGHPFSKFGTGNLMTLHTRPKLHGVNVRDALLEFHSKWYSANIMSLAVLGKENLDELEDLVCQMFGDVEDKHVEIPTWPDHPFIAEQVGVKNYVTSVKDIRDLSILFPIPDYKSDYRSSPIRYVSHLIGHEGPGSLLSFLKQAGWCNNLVCGNHSEHRGFSFLLIHVDLTETGIKNIDKIIQSLFQYINIIKKEGPQKWIFEECRDLSEIHFRFKDKSSPIEYVTAVSNKIPNFPMEDVLCANYSLTDWKPELIEEVFSFLHPHQMWIATSAKRYKEISNEKEKWYGTEFKREKIPKELLVMFGDESSNSSLRLPDKNEFIPKNFDILPRDESSSQYPVIIMETPLCRVWYKQDDEFLVPKSNFNFSIISPYAYVDPMCCSMTHMYVTLFKDYLSEYAYSAYLAGLKCDLTNTKSGMMLGVTGYNDKQKEFLEDIISKMMSFKIDPERFNILKEKYIRYLGNFNAEQPYHQCMFYLALLLSEQAWTKSELLEAAEKVTLDQLEAFIPRLMSQLYVEALFHGNITKQISLDVVSTVMDKLNGSTGL